MTVITFHVSFTDTLKPKGEDILSAINISESTLDIHESYSVSKKRKLNAKFKEAVDLCKSSGSKLMINSFDSFKSNYECIRTLWEAKIDFEFLDFPYLKKANLKLLLEYLTYSKSIRGSKIRSTIKSRKEEGEKQGLEYLSKRKLKKVSATANHYKKLSISIDPLQDFLRKKIYELREEKKYSLQKIADILNETDKTSPTGKEFHPKTISRFFEAAIEVKNRSLINEELEDEVSALRGAGPSPSHNMKSKRNKKGSGNSLSNSHSQGLSRPSANRPKFKLHGVTNESDFKDTLKFKILKTNKLTAEILIEIYDNNDPPNPLYRKNYPANSKEISIDLESIINMYPGRYYLKVTSTSFEMEGITRSFFYYKDKLIL